MITAMPELGLFAAAFAVAIATPGPFAAALVARGAALGLPSAAGMALGGLVGDLVFATVALFGLSLLAEAFDGGLHVLRYAGAAWLIWLGVKLLTATRPQPGDTAAVRRGGVLAGFLSGSAVGLGNPKAALFYAAVFPGLFDIPRLSGWDIAAIYATIITIVLIGNMGWALAAARAGHLLRSPVAVQRVNRVAGGVLTGTGAAIAAT